MADETGDAGTLQPWTGRQKLLVGLVASTVVLDGADNQLLGITIPALMGEWAVSRAAFAPVLASGLIGMLIGGAAAGLIGDRLGRKRALLGSVVMFGVLTLAAAAANGPIALAVLRFLAGLGLGGAMPNAAALAAEFVPRNRRALAVTLTIVCVPVGGILAAALSEPLLPHLGWRGLFALGGVVPVVLAGVLTVVLPESPVFIEAQARQVERASIGALFAPALRRDTIGLWIAFFANLLAVYCCFNWVPAMLAGAGFGATASRGLLAFNLGGVIGAFGGAAFVTRYGSRPTLLSLAASAVAVALVMAAMPIAASAPVAAIGMLALLGCLLNTVQIAMYSLAVHVYPTSVRATGIGWALAFGRSGGVFSSYTGEWALAAGGSAAFFGVIAAAMAAVYGALATVRRHMPSAFASRN
ncbi:MAG: MFS transporter [Acidobacteriota bacterium]|nr:MFS transporter [Acidobacteriota bacterium]